MATLHTTAFIHPNLYKDSVALMRVAQRLLALPDVVNATLQMGNTANKEILQEAGLLTADVTNAGPSDIMVVVQAKTAAACTTALAECQGQLAGNDTSASSANNAGAQEIAPRTVGMGLARWASAGSAAWVCLPMASGRAMSWWMRWPCGGHTPMVNQRCMRSLCKSPLRVRRKFCLCPLVKSGSGRSSWINRMMALPCVSTARLFSAVGRAGRPWTLCVWMHLMTRRMSRRSSSRAACPGAHGPRLQQPTRDLPGSGSGEPLPPSPSHRPLASTAERLGGRCDKADRTKR